MSGPERCPVAVLSSSPRVEGVACTYRVWCMGCMVVFMVVAHTMNHTSYMQHPRHRSGLQALSHSFCFTTSQSKIPLASPLASFRRVSSCEEGAELSKHAKSLTASSFANVISSRAAAHTRKLHRKKRERGRLPFNALDRLRPASEATFPRA